MLHRLGNKTQLAAEIYSHFPPHRMRIELFFGAGGLFFNVPPAKFNVLNDLDSDITNLYLVIQEQKEELKKELELMPVSSQLIEHWKRNKETDPIKKALRFLLISNFTYLGKGDTLHLEGAHTKRNLLRDVEPIF